MNGASPSVVRSALLRNNSQLPDGKRFRWPNRGRDALGGAKRRSPRDGRPAGKALVACLSAHRRAGVEASMEQMETAQRLAGCSFAVNGVSFRGKLKASMEQILKFH